MKKILSVLSLIVIFSACDNEEDLFLTTIFDEITTDYLLQGDLDVYIQGEQVFRQKGKPGIDSIPIGRENLDDYENCFVLYISNGSESVGTVSSANINLDGQELLNTSDFSGEGVLYDFEVCNLTNQSVLVVEVRGEPGSYIEIWMEGILINQETEGTFVDCRDSIEYKWIKIGNQTWMAENLAYETSSGSWAYDNNESNVAIYGRLYDWATVMNGANSSPDVPSGVQGICPCEWHVPSMAEWTELSDYLGGHEVAGGKMKETGTIHWASPNVGATNESGFSGLPYGSGTYCNWWSATMYDITWPNNGAWYRTLAYNNQLFAWSNYNLDGAMSVRCVKD